MPSPGGGLTWRGRFCKLWSLEEAANAETISEREWERQLRRAEARESLKFSAAFVAVELSSILGYLLWQAKPNLLPIFAMLAVAGWHALALLTTNGCRGLVRVHNYMHSMLLVAMSLCAALCHPEVQRSLEDRLGVLSALDQGTPSCDLLDDESTGPVGQPACFSHFAVCITMLLLATLAYFIVFVLTRKHAVVGTLVCVATYCSVVGLLGSLSSSARLLELLLFFVNVAVVLAARWVFESQKRRLQGELWAKSNEALQEKVLRCEVEFENERLRGGRSSQLEGRNHVSGFVEYASLPNQSSEFKTTRSERLLQAEDDDDHSMVLQHIASVGSIEHWRHELDEILLNPERVLGEGGFGMVVAGSLHGTPTAVKIAKSFSISERTGWPQLRNELRILRHVRHPNIVQFYGASTDIERGMLIIMMELVEGEILSAFVERRKNYPSAELYPIILDLGSALRYMHARDPAVVHGDLKPSNVMIEQGRGVPRAKLLDFGLSRLCRKHIKRMGGTRIWMAPEVARGDLVNFGRPSDVFSFGRLTHFVLTGEKPFAGVPLPRMKKLVKEVAPPFEWDTAVALCEDCRRLCNEAVAFQPEDRPDMAEVHRRMVRGMTRMSEEEDFLSWNVGISRLWQREKEAVLADCVYELDLLDPQLRILASNPACRKVFGDVSQLRDVLDPETCTSLRATVVRRLESRGDEDDPEEVEIQRTQGRLGSGFKWEANICIEFVEETQDFSANTSNKSTCPVLLYFRETRVVLQPLEEQQQQAQDRTLQIEEALQRSEPVLPIVQEEEEINEEDR